jgi:hypothetical protein
MRESAEEMMFEAREKAYSVFAGVIEGPAGVVLLASAIATNEAKTSEVRSAADWPTAPVTVNACLLERNEMFSADRHDAT